MQEEQDKERRLALDRLLQIRAQVKKDNRLPSLLVRPFVLHRFRQTERMLEASLDPEISVRSFTYTVSFTRKGGHIQRVVTTETELPPQVIDILSEQAPAQEDVSGYEALKALTAQSQAALQSGDVVTAARLASELLARNTDRTSWNYGNVIHGANQILGLAALHTGDTGAAREYLLAAGRTPGSPQLDSFGPTMTLAQALLRQGEREVVLTYLDDVARFWASPKKTKNLIDSVLGRVLSGRNANSIKAWKAAIQRGEVPNLNRIV
jgi:hypothetical protein